MPLNVKEKNELLDREWSALVLAQADMRKAEEVAFTSGTRVTWTVGGIHKQIGTVLVVGGRCVCHGRVRVRNERTHAERWIETAQLRVVD